MTDKSQRSLDELKVLVAEDEWLHQILLKRLLSKLGVEGDFVTNGADVISKMNAGKYDIILMDIMMPVVDGITATERIRASEGDKKNIIIAMTAAFMKSDIERYLAAGMNDYIAKPIDIHILAEKLHRWHV